MKKTYMTPIATEERFVANEYVAKCTWQITSESGNNRMKCANPSHDHFASNYFTSVWVAATHSTCQIIVTQDGIGKTAIYERNNFFPLDNAIVYGAKGEIYNCTTKYYREADKLHYNVPSNVTGKNTGPCYGTYVNTGDYKEIMEKVFS